MESIYGAYANAVVYSVANEHYNLDPQARRQIQAACNSPAAKGCVVRIMPDVHACEIGTVGFTMTVKDKVLPGLVGADIGCGMTMAKLDFLGKKADIGDKKVNFEELDRVIKKSIPSGIHTRDRIHPLAQETKVNELTCLKCIHENDAYISFGTLGGGNHFIEVDTDGEDYYLIIHSGSRSLGIDTAKYYMEMGKMEARANHNEKQMPYGLVWLEGSLKDDYLHDIDIVQEYAALSRRAMLAAILNGMSWGYKEMYSCIHNYIDLSSEIPILRKGAISAKKDEKVIIPINMKDGVILGDGLGNPAWNYSAPHGAGRICKRSEVKDYFSVKEYEEEMKGIYSSCIGKGTLDEAPFAYRRIDSIKESISDTVRIEKILKPVYNYKKGSA